MRKLGRRGAAVQPRWPKASTHADRTDRRRAADCRQQIGNYRVTRATRRGRHQRGVSRPRRLPDRDVAIKRVRAVGPRRLDRGALTRRASSPPRRRWSGACSTPTWCRSSTRCADPAEPYLVMEYVAGSTLRPYCRPDQLLSLESDRRDRLQVRDGARLRVPPGPDPSRRQAGQPARHVRRQRTIRDVKITDFGSVLNLGSDVTQIHRVGSLAYMSPEQLDGGTLDCRADMYSLGAVLYHLIAGRPPFDGQVSRRMMHQIYRAEPAPLTGVRDGVPRRARCGDPARPREDAGRALRRLGRVRAGAVRARERAQKVPRGDLQGVLDSERFNLLRSARVLRRLRRRRAVGGRAPRQVAALSVRRMRCTARASPATASTSWPQGEVEVFRDGQRVAAARRRHLGRRDGLPGAEPGAEAAQHRRRRQQGGHDDLVHARYAGAAQRQLPPPVRRLVHPRAGAATARRARGAAHPRRIL